MINKTFTNNKQPQNAYLDYDSNTHTTSSLRKSIFTNVSWLASYKFVSQLISWFITIAIARILVPGDYGIMAMATIITGYVEMFSELGLGAAIIQRKKISYCELSTVFWISFGISCVLAGLCFPLSYITAHLMHEARVIPLTQSIAVIFIMSSFCIVPSNILRRNLDFKTLGSIELISTIISLFGMLIIAKVGGGPWALVSGRIIRMLFHAILLYWKVGWRPQFYFNMREAGAFLKFGSLLAVARSLFYIQEKSDTFFAGRAWPINVLGLYGFALQLAHIPTEKITTLINQVTFPVFSKLQDNKEAFNNLYLNISKITIFIVLPLFLGGFFTGDLLIHTFLNRQWYPMIHLFSYFCLAQIFISMNAINSFVHSSQNRPHWSLIYNTVSVIVMPLSFCIAVQQSMNAMVYPWLTVFPFLCTGWTIITLRKIGIPLFIYLNNLRHPFFGSIFMCSGMFVVLKLLKKTMILPDVISLVIVMIFSALLYLLYFIKFDKNFLLTLRNNLKPDHKKNSSKDVKCENSTVN